MSHKKILSCDVGLKRIGLAIYMQGIILPIAPIMRKNRHQASNALSQILKEREIEVLVVGIPNLLKHKREDLERREEINEDLMSEEMERRIRHFISLVEFGGEVIYIDEALSSKMAQESLLDLSKKERREKISNGELDSLAAMEILRRYLDAKAKS